MRRKAISLELVQVMLAHKKLSLEQVEKMTAKTAGLWLVRDRAGTIIGQLEKYRTTRDELHPWKAFRGTGADRHYLGAFYKASGKMDAIAAILDTKNF